MRKLILFLSAFGWLLTTLLPCFSQTQLGTGAISGTVMDAAGSVIAGATVTVTNIDTGLVRNAQTTETGHFTVPVLPTGRYKVRVEAQGFSALEQENVTVNVGETATLQVKLKLGAIGETI